MIKLLLVLFTFSAFAQSTKLKTNELKVGKEDNQDVKITINNGAANSPYLLYDWSAGAWKQSSDGLTEEGIGGDTVLTTDGDLLYFNSASEQRLPIGLDGQFLTITAGLPAWTTIVTSPITTEGDLQIGDASGDPVRLPIGTPGQLLTVTGSTASWQDAPVLGGSAGINFISDDSFESQTLNPDSDGGGTESYQTYTTDAQLYSESNTKYFRASYTSLSAANTYVRDTFARTGLDNKQGLFSIWVKIDGDGFDLCLRDDDSSFAGSCEDDYTVDLIGDDTWRKYEIPFIFASASIEYEIRNSSYTGDVDIEIDKLYLGTMPDGYLKDVAVNTGWYDCTPTFNTRNDDASLGNGTIEGRCLRDGDTLSIEFGVVFGSTTNFGTNDFIIELPDNLVIDSSKGVGNENNLPCSTFNRDNSNGDNRIFNDGCIVTPGDDTSFTFFINGGTGDTPAGADGLDSATPFTWTSNDRLNGKVVGIPIQGWESTSGAIVAQPNNSETVKVIAYQTTSQTFTDNTTTTVTYDTEVEDNYSAHSNGVFTCPKTAEYNIKMGLHLQGVDDSGSIVIYQVNNTTQSVVNEIYRYRNYGSADTDNSDEASVTIKCTEDDVINMEAIVNTVDSGSTSSRTGTSANRFSNLSITEVVDGGTISGRIASTVTECQTKFLTADVTTSTTMSDLTFNNLEVGKKYSLKFYVATIMSSENNSAVNVVNGAQTIIGFNTGNTDATALIQDNEVSAKFTATGTTITFTTASHGSPNAYLGNSTFGETHATLCQLPDSTILNSTKFN